jgi:hypothetical protein
MRKRRKRVLLNVKRFKQVNAECAVAAVGSLAHYFRPEFTYLGIRKFLNPRDHVEQEGMYTSQQGRLLNCLGFKKVTIVMADTDVVDFSWQKLPKSTIIKLLRQRASDYSRCGASESAFVCRDLADWLGAEGFSNRLRIDYDFGKYIRRSLRTKRPVVVSVYFTCLHKMSNRVNDGEQHAFVIRGFDEEYVFVVDSYGGFSGKLRKYRNGYYKIKWEKLLVNMGKGDLVLVNELVPKL